MKLFGIVILLISFYSTPFGQNIDPVSIDNNPKLSIEESAWLNKHIQSDNFNFDNKYLGFTELLSGGFYGIGKFTLPLTKKNFFNVNIEKFIYQLYVLSPDEKKQTNGFDAILVITNKKGKMKRLKRESVIAESHNRFPQIPADAGVDNNPILNKSNAEFFNEIYKYDINYQVSFDFSGKKLAIFDTDCNTKIEQKTISEYVARMKEQLDKYGSCHPPFPHFLTEQQKKETGGYDIIILSFCKMGIPIDNVIKKLSNNSNTH
ncbi:MAG TPA: hypothetical protein VK483_00735 [Chitinophagaceae bacterium]|nr:hypothetical protein [Chitinophagaceae bacterium]